MSGIDDQPRLEQEALDVGEIWRAREEPRIRYDESRGVYLQTSTGAVGIDLPTLGHGFAVTDQEVGDKALNLAVGYVRSGTGAAFPSVIAFGDDGVLWISKFEPGAEGPIVLDRWKGDFITVAATTAQGFRLLRLDTNGQIVWSATEAVQGRLSDVLALPDGGAVVAANMPGSETDAIALLYWYDAAGSLTSATRFAKRTLVRLDAMGSAPIALSISEGRYVDVVRIAPSEIRSMCE